MQSCLAPSYASSHQASALQDATTKTCTSRRASYLPMQTNAATASSCSERRLDCPMRQQKSPRVIFCRPLFGRGGSQPPLPSSGRPGPAIEGLHVRCACARIRPLPRSFGAFFFCDRRRREVPMADRTCLHMCEFAHGRPCFFFLLCLFVFWLWFKARLCELSVFESHFASLVFCKPSRLSKPVIFSHSPSSTVGARLRRPLHIPPSFSACEASE